MGKISKVLYNYWSRLLVISLIFVVFLFSVWLFQKHYSTLKFESQWENTSKIMDTDEVIGYLYKVVFKPTQAKLLLVSDSQIKKTDYNQDFFSFEEKTKDRIWNPKVCSKMPNTILDNGNIYTLNTIYDGKDFKKEIIRFNLSTNEYNYLDINSLNMISEIYHSNDVVFFFIEHSDALYKVSIPDNNFNNILFEKQLELTKTENAIVYTKSSDVLLRLDDTKELNKKKFFVYDWGDHVFKPKEMNLDSGLEVDMQKNMVLQKGTSIYYDTFNQLNVGIDADGKRIPFLNRSSEIFVYVIDDF